MYTVNIKHSDSFMSLTHTLYPKRILHRLFYVHFCILLLHLGACVTTVGRVSLIVFGPDAGFKFHPFFFPCFPRQVFRWYTVKPSHTFHLAKDTDAFGREKHSHESLARGIQSGLWKLTVFFFFVSVCLVMPGVTYVEAWARCKSLTSTCRNSRLLAAQKVFQ